MRWVTVLPGDVLYIPHGCVHALGGGIDGILTLGGDMAGTAVRAVEDAILTRARQLRVRDGQL